MQSGVRAPRHADAVSETTKETTANGGNDEICYRGSRQKSSKNKNCACTWGEEGAATWGGHTRNDGASLGQA